MKIKPSLMKFVVIVVGTLICSLSYFAEGKGLVGGRRGGRYGTSGGTLTKDFGKWLISALAGGVYAVGILIKNYSNTQFSS